MAKKVDKKWFQGEVDKARRKREEAVGELVERWDDLPTKLFKARRAAGVSQKATAEAAGLKVKRLRELETGKTEPSLAELRAVCGTLGITLGDLKG